MDKSFQALIRKEYKNNPPKNPQPQPSYKLPKTKPLGKVTVGQQYKGREGVTLFKVAKSLFFGK